MSEQKQTAVEWLYDQLPDHLRLSENGFDMLQKAKKMEKKQIIDAIEDCRYGNGDEYYNETYLK